LEHLDGSREILRNDEALHSKGLDDIARTETVNPANVSVLLDASASCVQDKLNGLTIGGADDNHHPHEHSVLLNEMARQYSQARKRTLLHGPTGFDSLKLLTACIDIHVRPDVGG